MKIIVTGGAGFIGSNIVDALIDKGYEVHIIDNMSAGKIENVNKKATLHIVDIRDFDAIMPLFKNVQYVFHEAAIPQVQYSIENPIETNEINVSGILNVLEACRLNSVKRLIFASSCSIYGNQDILPVKESAKINPLSPYALHKSVGEMYCRLYSEIYNLETVCLRYFNVYGERQSITGSYPLVIARFLDQKKNNKPLTVVGDGKNTRDYVNVKDVARANILAIESTLVGKGEGINIGSGREYSVNDIANMVGGEITYIEPRIEPKNIRADISLAKNLLNWEPVLGIEEEIEKLK